MKVTWRAAAFLLFAASAGGCSRQTGDSFPSSPSVALAPLPTSLGTFGPARVGGRIAPPQSPASPHVSIGSGTEALNQVSGSAAGIPPLPGPVSLDFADTDIREIAAQILGSILKVNYTIDPAVKGTGTFHSAHPLTAPELLQVLRVLLGQSGAALVRTGDLYRVLPATTAAGMVGIASAPGGAGGIVIPLRYVSAADLAKVVAPVIGTGARVVADPGQNAIIVSGDPEARDAVAGLVRSFDSDVLRGQSYALLPVPAGTTAKDFANTMQTALLGQPGMGGAGVIRVLPLSHADAVLVVAREPAYVEAARRVYGLIEARERDTLRAWHIHYLRNSNAEDTAYLLQRAFTPDDVTAQPSNTEAPSGGTGTGTGTTAQSPPGAGGAGQAGYGGGAPPGLALAAPTSGAPAHAAASAGAASANPLLGGLDQGGGAPTTDRMRIIADRQNNAVLIYGTAREDGQVAATLQKVDLLPLQVRIDATIAEVTLTDQLKYGTQFFFKEGDLNQTLSEASTGTFQNAFPGFVLGATAKTAQAAISALRAVTQVKVLSAPELLVQDGKPATLQVGDLVPYLTQSSQSTLVNEAPIISSINYRQTGVILKVTPRVDTGGEVALDVAQEVSAIDTSAPTFQSIDSPTFSERLVQSHLVVRDGQTVGLAGLISDSNSVGNSGLPFLRNIPILSLLTSTQNNQRTRTELLVLITPHVVHDAADAQALTEDLLRQLPNAATVPFSGRAPIVAPVNPSAPLLHRIGVPP